MSKMEPPIQASYTFQSQTVPEDWDVYLLPRMPIEKSKNLLVKSGVCPQIMHRMQVPSRSCLGIVWTLGVREVEIKRVAEEQAMCGA